MGLFKKHDTAGVTLHPEPQLLRRIRAAGTPELLEWADVALYTAGRCLSEYRKSGETFWLTDAEQSTSTLHLLVAEIRTRVGAPAYAPPSAASPLS